MYVALDVLEHIQKVLRILLMFEKWSSLRIPTQILWINEQDASSRHSCWSGRFQMANLKQ